MFSIQTNQPAQIALASLTSVSTQVNKLENEASTGLKVSGAQDNASLFAVAQGIRATLKGYDAANASLQNAQGLLSVSISSTTQISNMLIEVTKTLTSLSDGSISDAQRQTYTAQFQGQLASIQSVISSSYYNGVNLLGWDIDQANIYGGIFPKVTNVSVLASPTGQIAVLRGENLIGGFTAGLATNGFVGLARLGYWVGNAPYLTANDLNTNNIVYAGTSYTNINLISRSEIQQNEAIAALAPISNVTGAYYTSPTATAGVPSVFNSALAIFSQDISSALSGLSQDYNNIQTQITFNQALTDSYTDGLGGLVDANLATVSAQLTAVQTRQYLATQSLAIANAAPNILSQLFAKAS